MGNFPECPIPNNMNRKDRMSRVYKKLIDIGLYVKPVCLDESHGEWGYFIVAVDNPYLVVKK